MIRSLKDFYPRGGYPSSNAPLPRKIHARVSKGAIRRTVSKRLANYLKMSCTQN